ncbi:MAG: hypothetical protein KDA42_15440 [Planctomycetales bacterium]|nr:hypothetical protein [Planctomycetales bacterium]
MSVVRIVPLFLGCAFVLAATACAEPSPAPPPALVDLDKKHEVHLIYFVPQDREPTADYAEKIRVVATFVADLYRSDLTAQGFQTRGLDFAFVDGAPQVRLVRGQHRAQFYNGAPNYDRYLQIRTIKEEVLPVVGSFDDRVTVVFAETYDDGPSQFEWPGGMVALGGPNLPYGGFGLFSAWILRDEFCATTVERQIELLKDATPIEGRTALGSGRPNSPRFEFIEDGIGAVAHEIGHALGLPHDARDQQRNIMGNGFRRLRSNYLAGQPAPRAGFSPDNARILAASRYLAEDVLSDDTQPPRVRFACPKQIESGQLSVGVSVDLGEDDSVAAALIYSATHDSVVGGASLRDQTGKQAIELKLPSAEPGELKLELRVIDRGGNLAFATNKIEVVATPE